MRPAAASTAAPPSEWPMRMTGAAWLSRSQPAAQTRSSTLEEKSVLAKSPSDEPRPVKSKRSTATPAAASPLAMRRAANASFVQVKQWATSAKACTEPLGSSSRAASSSPPLPGNVARMTDGALMAQPPLLVPREAQTAAEVVLCRTDHGSAAFFAFSPTRLAENGWLSLARDVALGVRAAFAATLESRPVYPR